MLGRSLGVVFGVLGLTLGLLMLGGTSPLPGARALVGFIWLVSMFACMATAGRSSGAMRVLAITLAATLGLLIVLLVITSFWLPAAMRH